MKRALFVAVLAILSWLVFGAHDASWARPQAAVTTPDQRALSKELHVLRRGTEITVYLTDGSKLKGVLREVRDDAIVLQLNRDGTSTIPLAAIQRVKTKGLHGVTKVLLVVGATLGGLLVVAAATC